MTVIPTAGDDWVAEACTLPTTERPVRRGEFDDLFTRDLMRVVRESPTRTRLDLHPDPQAAARAAAVAVKETGCCSFFTFDLSIGDGTVSLAVSTSASQRAVLAALSARAEFLMGDSA